VKFELSHQIAIETVPNAHLLLDIQTYKHILSEQKFAYRIASSALLSQLEFAFASVQIPQTNGAIHGTSRGV